MFLDRIFGVRFSSLGSISGLGQVRISVRYSVTGMGCS